MEQRYASYMDMTVIPYNIILKLATDASDKVEMLWKLLKYTDLWALSKPNLTFEEKMDLVWTPEKVTSTRTQDTFNVFLKPLVSASLNEATSQTQLRLYRYKTSAINQTSSTLLYEFDVMVNESSAMVYDLSNRMIEKTDLMEALLIDIMNMTDLGVGVNFLRFTRMQGGNCESVLNINNAKSTYGRSFLLALSYIDTSLGGECNG